jgi:chemotaxis protein MotB
MNPRVHRSRVTHDRWLISYADFITLLFAFFVVLYAFAKADQKKQAEFSPAIDGAFRSLGILSDRTLQKMGSLPYVQSVMSEAVLSPGRVKDDLDQIQSELQLALSAQVARHEVSIQMGSDGLVISLREAGFFDSGSAIPRPETLDTLRKITASVGRTPYDVRVEGHTDNVPIHTNEFDSNWELSSARATRIARMILALHAISSDRLAAAGYAEFHPVDSNATTEGRGRNRRVDLVILPRSRIDLAAASSVQGGAAWARITDRDP